MANTAITVGTTAVTAVLFAPTNTAFRVEVADGSGSVQLLSKVGAGAWSHVAMVPFGGAVNVDNPVSGVDYKLEYRGNGPTPVAYWS